MVRWISLEYVTANSANPPLKPPNENESIIRMNLFQSSHRLVGALAVLWTLSASAQGSTTIPTNLRENESGFRVQLTRRTDGCALPGQLIQARIVYKDPRLPQPVLPLRTSTRGIVSVPASNGILKVVFDYRGTQLYRPSRVTDSNPR